MTLFSRGGHLASLTIHSRTFSGATPVSRAHQTIKALAGGGRGTRRERERLRECTRREPKQGSSISFFLSVSSIFLPFLIPFPHSSFFSPFPSSLPSLHAFQNRHKYHVYMCACVYTCTYYTVHTNVQTHTSTCII